MVAAAVEDDGAVVVAGMVEVAVVVLVSVAEDEGVTDAVEVTADAELVVVAAAPDVVAVAVPLIICADIEVIAGPPPTSDAAVQPATANNNASIATPTIIIFLITCPPDYFEFDCCRVVSRVFSRNKFTQPFVPPSGYTPNLGKGVFEGPVSTYDVNEARWDKTNRKLCLLPLIYRRPTARK